MQQECAKQHVESVAGKTGGNVERLVQINDTKFESMEECAV